MDRRQFLIRSSLAATAAAIPFHSLFARKIESFTPLRNNVGYFTERGGTIGWLVSPDGFVIVDSQYPQTAEMCLKGLQNRTDRPLDVLINTHHHGDHTNGNTVFKPVAKKMVAHENVPKLMRQSAGEGSDGERPAYPETTFKSSWNISLGNEKVHVKYYGRAHTSGDSVIYFENANIVHMGDLVFNRMNPYTDRPAGASVHNWAKVLKTVEEEYPADAIYIFGHGKEEFGVTGSKEDVGVMRSYLSAMIEYVQEGVEAGQSKEKIIGLKSLPGFDHFRYASWWTLSQNLEVIYQEIMEK